MAPQPMAERIVRIESKLSRHIADCQERNARLDRFLDEWDAFKKEWDEEGACEDTCHDH